MVEHAAIRLLVLFISAGGMSAVADLLHLLATVMAWVQRAWFLVRSCVISSAALGSAQGRIDTTMTVKSCPAHVLTARCVTGAYRAWTLVHEPHDGREVPCRTM